MDDLFSLFAEPPTAPAPPAPTVPEPTTPEPEPGSTVTQDPKIKGTTGREGLFGEDLFGNPIQPKAKSTLHGRFMLPPFSVLSARDGDWQSRKRAWLSLGIQSEIGREAKAFTTEGTWLAPDTTGTSIFDPVLCELAYCWFCPPGGQVVDPFAGGSVRGIVAGSLGCKYWGCDLSAQQVAANEAQRHICPEAEITWVVGDSTQELAKAPEADFVFSCPPYGSLERYSDDPRDLSAMDPDQFLEGYRKIIALACSRLKPNRFAAFVIGDYRLSSGNYANFVSQTANAFVDAGLPLYNEAILVTAIGSLPIRITRQFQSGRKLGKTHQNLLVFVKGDWKKAAAACAPLETSETTED